MYVGITGMIIAMITVPLILNKVELKDNNLYFDNKIVQIEENNDNLIIKIDDKEISNSKSAEQVNKVKEVMQNNSKTKIIITTLLSSALITSVMVLASIIFKKANKLFRNLHDGDTPFTRENVNTIKKIAYFTIAIIIIQSLANLSMEMLSKQVNLDINMTNIFEILLLFALSYIFEYGYEIQLDSKGKIYGEED